MAYIDYGKNGSKDKKTRMIGFYFNQRTNVINSLKLAKEEKNKKYLKIKREEIEFLCNKYNLPFRVIGLISRSYLNNSEIPDGSIYKIDELINVILKNIYEFNEEEIRSYICNNFDLFACSYNIFVIRLALYNHFYMLDDILFGNTSYLKSHYPRKFINTKEIYAIIMEYNVNNFNELKDAFYSVYDEDLVKLVKKYPLSDKMVYEFKEELKSKINKKAFMLELKRRKSMKEKK